MKPKDAILKYLTETFEGCDLSAENILCNLEVVYGMKIPDTLPFEDEACPHKFGHYSGDEYEHCRLCGERGDKAAKEPNGLR